MDYYSVLGLGPGANVTDIKRAYRRLARRHHPGLNPGDRASEALFERISEAYETLLDPERRRRYDAAGTAGDGGAMTFEFTTGFDFSVAAHGPQAATFTELFADVLHPMPRAVHTRPEPGADLHASLSLSFEDALRGAERHIVVTRQVPCAACEGAGDVTTAGGNCPTCRGAGQVRWARGHMVFTKPCAECGGSGREKQRRCTACAGQGRAVMSEGVGVRIPAGVRDGARVRIPERGHSGRLGAPNGNLYIDIQVTPHRLWHRDGDDLHIVVPVAINEAALGARIEVPSIDGPVRLKIPPGTQAGHRFRVTGRGASSVSGGRGDLYVEVRLVLPDVLDERSKEFSREFGRLNAGDVRRALHDTLKAEH